MGDSTKSLTPTALTISNPAAGNVSATAAAIGWQTNVPAGSQVEYGTTTSYGSSTALDSTMVINHQQNLSSLKPATAYHFRVHSTDANKNEAVGVDMTFTTTPDTTAPTVSMTAPASGATVSGTVTVAANATDDVGVASMQFQLDGASLGSLVTTSPYSVLWDTTKSTSGQHALSAIARDAAGNSATGASVTVTVNSATAPTITTQPANQTVTAGQTATFAVAATGTAPLSYQWQKNAVNIAGATASSYTTPVTTTADSGSTFAVVVTNTAGTATSNTATLTVNPAPVAPTITTQPANQTVTAGQAATFAVAATGTTPLSYQWQKNAVNIAGATASSYTTPVTTTADSGSTFRVVVTNTTGTATSNAATLTVNVDATAPTVPGALSASAVSSSQINLSWTASTDNVGVTGYNVYRAGVKIGTAPSNSYQDGGLSASTSYSYNVSAFDAAGNTSAQSAGASATTQAASGGGGIPTALGWYQIPNTKMRPVCPPNTAAYAFNDNCQNVVAAWSGGIADTKRNRLLVWGGGHVDYYGNEVYALDLNNLTMNRLNNPGPLDPGQTCVSALSDGTANARHTYGGLSYIAHADKMYVFSGIVACTNGGGTNDTWTLDLPTLTWKREDPTTGAPPSLALGQGYSDYDPNTKNVFVDAVINFSSYNFDTNTYTSLNGSQNWISAHASAVIDPGRKLFIIFGPNDGNPWGTLVYDISQGSSYQLQNWTSQTTGCSALQNANFPGLAYDPVQKVIVGWAGGDTVYLFNPDTKTCTPVTYPNGPGAPQTNGTHGRFRYFPSLGVFAVVNNVDGNAYTLRIDPATLQALSVSNVSTNSVTSASANVTWTTNNAANSQVFYGTTSSYGSTTTLDANLVTSHTVSVSSLNPATTYHFQVKSLDSGGSSASSGDVTFTTSPATNPVPPVLSSVTATNIAANSATITWTTDQSANSQVFYGTTTAYGSSSSLDSTLVTSHTVNISGLTAATQYHLQAQSQNAGGIMGTSADLVFTTGPGTVPNPSASDTVTIQETSGTAQANRAVSIPRAFVQGEIPNYAQASIGGTPVLTQCDVKNRWPDGSLKFAVVSLVIPSLPANGTVTIAFSNQSTGNNAGGLAQTDMLSAPYNFEAQVQESGASSHTASARTMLSNGSFRYWLQGPIVTAVIIEDRSTARTYDFNTDGGAGNPLHPIFEAWFYPQGNRVEAGYTVENVWAGSTTTNSMRDQTYSFALVSGQTTPTTHFTQASFIHIGRSRWYRHFWVGNNTPPAIRIDHNLAYMVQTKVIPNYNTALVLDNALVSAEFSGAPTGPQPVTSSGNIPKDMNAGGAADTIGLMAKGETMYLMTMGADDRMLTVVLGNADQTGRVPFHYRESDTNLFFDAGNSVNAFARVPSVNARPMEDWGIGFNSDYNNNCSGANTKTLNLGNVTADGWDTNGMDSSHWPEMGFVAYLITGKYYFMEETEMAGAYMLGWSGGCPGARRSGAFGILNEPQPGRGVAWAFRAVTHAWLSSPDASPEQAYFSDKLENTIAAFEGKQAITISDPSRLAAWTLGTQDQDSKGPSPLHFWYGGEAQFIESPMRTDGFLAAAWSPWEESYLLCTFGMARDAGLVHAGDLLAWGANRWFHLALDTTNVNNIYLVGTYRFPTKLAATNSWVTNYSDYKTAFLGNGGGLPTSWTSNWSCNYAPDDDKRYEGLATLGFLYPYTADGFSGQNAWNTVYQSMWNTSGCLPADYQSGANASPKWAILARTK